MTFIAVYSLIGFFAAASTVVLGAFYSLRQKDRKYGIACLKVGSTSAIMCLIITLTIGVRIANADAQLKGFEDAQDQRLASAENYDDASLWHAVQTERRKAADLKATQLIQRHELEQQAAETRAKAEQERQAAETRAKAEQERQAAETRAKAEQERQAAETRAKAEQERQAAETRARVEKERLVTDAQAAADYYNTKMKQLYAQSTLRSITLLDLSLKDASSAAVQNYKINKLPDGKVVLCGYINGKNSFGSYTGFRRFVVAADIDVAEFEGSTQDATFDSAWNNWCVNRDE